MWRIARDSKGLDVNSPYSYLLWCRDFAETSVISRDPAGACGFITGYLRPEAADTFFVWQVAVAPEHRGKGVALGMLDHLSDRLAARGCRYAEATVTPGNKASARLFESFAEVRGAQLERRELFATGLFPDGHEPEVLFRIGPIPDRRS